VLGETERPLGFRLAQHRAANISQAPEASRLAMEAAPCAGTRDHLGLDIQHGREMPFRREGGFERVL